MASTDPILSALKSLEGTLVDRLTAEMDRRFGDFRTEMNGRFDAIETRLEHLEIEYQMTVAGLKRIEERLADDGADRARLRTEVVQLRAKVADLDTRIREIETRLADE
jgi:chromosome segregation ATPase